MHSGISRLMRAMQQRFPQASQFVDFSEFASGPALVKGVAASPCFVNVCGEWGHKLRRLAEDKRGTDTAMQSLRKEMTNLYSKSGPTAVMGGIRYSNKDSNIESVSGVAYSMIGETTPATFYTALTTSMMADGFMSRLCIVEYSGPRPPLNTARATKPSKELADWLAGLAWHAVTLGSKNEFRQVALDLDVEELISDFESECDKHINSTRDESYRQAWNRAALKVMRMAGLLAASDNPIFPCVTFEHVEWALALVRRDIATFMRRWEAGDIGDADDDHKRRVKLMDVLHKAFNPTHPLNVDERTRKMLQCCVMPLKYLLPKLSNQTAFTCHKLGQNEAIKLTLRNLCDAGVLVEIPAPTLEKDFNYRGKAYRLLDPSL